MNLPLTVAERESLKRHQRNVSDRPSYVKVTTILFLDKGIEPVQISELLGIDTSTVYRYYHSYLSDGLVKYLSTDYKGYWGLLSSNQLSQLRKELNTNIYTDSKDIAQWIKNQWGIEYSSSGVVDLLNRIGFTYKQTTQVPCETDPKKQEDFIETLAQILPQANDNEVVIYFVDGVHPTHNTRSTHAWVEKGTNKEQPTVSGRDRVNINAALNAQKPTDVIAIASETINAQSTQVLYQKIINANPLAKTIYIISDNARYYRNKELSLWIESTPIKPIYLPPYSPNLNVIERLWKFLRKKVINTNFYRKKEDFRKAVLKFFEDIDLYSAELATLLTLNFRLSNSKSFSF